MEMNMFAIYQTSYTTNMFKKTYNDNIQTLKYYELRNA